MVLSFQINFSTTGWPYIFMELGGLTESHDPTYWT